MANPALWSRCAALGYLPSNGDDGVVTDERRAFVQTQTRRHETFVVLEHLRRLVADSASFPAHHSWGLVFAYQFGC